MELHCHRMNVSADVPIRSEARVMRTWQIGACSTKPDVSKRAGYNHGPFACNFTFLYKYGIIKKQFTLFFAVA